MRKWFLLGFLAILTTMTHPARAQFCPGVSPWVFDDVQASDPFCGYITWMAQNGITLGCGIIDANHRLYCPGDGVSRSQMAAFLNRLGNVRVEAVGTGPGLTGGPITSIGTINLATTQLLPTTACANNQIARWNGSAWVCSTDANSGGTVTSVATGPGLSGGPITSSGTINLASTQLLPAVACTTNQIPKWNGSAWACAADASSGGTVTSVTAGNGLTGGTITTSGTIAVDPASTTLTGNFFKQGGNAFAALPNATAVLGTTNGNALDVRVNGARVMRYEPNAISPNVIGGSPANNVAAGVRGATIGGGGIPAGNTDPDLGYEAPNRVTDAYGTVGGGYGNRAGDDAGTVTDQPFATVGGGVGNTASATFAIVGGGFFNTASGMSATIAGGVMNTASGPESFVGGGSGNVASGFAAWAAGHEAHADTDGCFLYTSWNGSGTGAQWGSCLGLQRVARFELDHGLSVDYFARRLDGGGTRWVYIGDALANGNTISTWTGAALTDAGVWANASDRALKDDFRAVDPREVLEGVIALPVTRWRYRTESEGVSHIGPTAQDFHAAFGLGVSDRTIGTVDSEGVALAAIQGLNAKLERAIAERDATIASQARELDAQRSEIAELRRAVEVLLARTSPEGRIASR